MGFTLGHQMHNSLKEIERGNASWHQVWLTQVDKASLKQFKPQGKFSSATPPPGCISIFVFVTRGFHFEASEAWFPRKKNQVGNTVDYSRALLFTVTEAAPLSKYPILHEGQTIYQAFSVFVPTKYIRRLSTHYRITNRILNHII